MSQLITASTQVAAQALAAKAHAYLTANLQGYRATKWDEPIQNSTTGEWGIEYDDRLAPAFTAGELLGVVAFSPQWSPPVP